MFGLSTAERQFLIEGVELNVRNDGRSRLDFRHLALETGVIATANGSARLKLDNTDVMVGVRVDLSEPEPDRPDEGVHASLCSFAFVLTVRTGCHRND